MAVTEQTRRRFLRVAAGVMAVAVVGLPLAFRAISPFTDSGFLPAAPGLVQIGLGIALGLAGVLVHVRGTVDAGRVTTLPALPRPVRRDVYRLRAVPEDVRPGVPDWLDLRCALCRTAAGTILWGLTTGLVLNADDTVRSLEVSAGLAVVALLVLGLPLAVYGLVLRRARRHYA